MDKTLRVFLPALLVLCSVSSTRGQASAASPEDAEALIQAGHWKRARTLLEPAVKTHPDNAPYAFLLAQVKMAFQDFQGALPLAQHAVELDGKNSNYHLKLGQIYGELAARASLFAAGSLAIKFRKEVETALELDGKNLEALDSMLQFKYEAPGLMGGDKAAASALADTIARLNPTRGYLAQAELAELEKKPAEQENNYLKAVEANPQSYQAQISLARFLTSPPQAKLAAAIEHAQRAIQIDPSRAAAYGILARAYTLSQRWKDLEALLTSAEKNVPDDLCAYYEAARAGLETGKDFPRAEAYAKRYLAQEPEGEEPDWADAHRLLGLVYEKEGRSAEAGTEIETALRIRPNFKAAKEDLRRVGK